MSWQGSKRAAGSQASWNSWAPVIMFASDRRSMGHLSDLHAKRAHWVFRQGQLSSNCAPSPPNAKVGHFLNCLATVQHCYVDEFHARATLCLIYHRFRPHLFLTVEGFPAFCASSHYVFSGAGHSTVIPTRRSTHTSHFRT